MPLPILIHQNVIGFIINMEIDEESEREKAVRFNQYVQNNSNGELSISILNDLEDLDGDVGVDYNGKKLFELKKNR